MKHKYLIIASIALIIGLSSLTYYVMGQLKQQATPNKQTSEQLNTIKDFDKLVDAYLKLGKELSGYDAASSSYPIESSYAFKPTNETYRVRVGLGQIGGYVKKDKTDKNLQDIVSKTTKLFTDKGFKQTSLTEPSGKNSQLFDSSNVLCKLVVVDYLKDAASYSAVFCSNKDEKGLLATEAKEVANLLAKCGDKDKLVLSDTTVQRLLVSEGDKSLTKLTFVYNGKLPSTAYFATAAGKTEYLGSVYHGSSDSETPIELPSGITKAAADTATYGDFLKRQLKW